MSTDGSGAGLQSSSAVNAGVAKGPVVMLIHSRCAVKRTASRNCENMHTASSMRRLHTTAFTIAAQLSSAGVVPHSFFATVGGRSAPRDGTAQNATAYTAARVHPCAPGSPGCVYMVLGHTDRLTRSVTASRRALLSAERTVQISFVHGRMRVHPTRRAA